MRFGVMAMVLATGCFYDNTSPLPADFGSCPVEEEPVVPAQPTWFRDVKPIITEKCKGCHTDGGIAPFPLEGYNDFAAVNGAIRDAVEARAMPPWQADPCCNHYKWDRSLSDDQRSTLLAWLDTGMAYGDPADDKPATPLPTKLPRVDLHAQMKVEYSPVARIGADEIRCFVLDHDPIDRDRYITGFGFTPGVHAEVHHVIVYAVNEDDVAEVAKHEGEDGRPGWDCWGEGGELGTSRYYLGGWGPGNLPRVLPEGIGRKLPAHTRIMLSIHYDTGHGSYPDLSSLDLMLEDHVDRIEKGTAVGNPLWFAGDGMEIPAGAPDTMHWFAWDPTVLTQNKAIEIHNVTIHMHELGSIGRAAILRKDGSTECLLNITQWNFHWMSDYYFETPVRIEPGDKIYVECHWDNTAEHQKVVNGVKQTPRTLHWGTDDEMCGAIMIYSEAL